MCVFQDHLVMTSPCLVEGGGSVRTRRIISLLFILSTVTPLAFRMTTGVLPLELAIDLTQVVSKKRKQPFFVSLLLLV